MGQKWVQPATFCFCVVALFCWFVMFFTGTDVWHDVGRPDFWNLQGVPYNDLRAFAYAFYLLFVVLCGQLLAATLGFLMGLFKAAR